ncbi:MAG: GHKL domain-containing protein [Clostridia bacterium]
MRRTRPKYARAMLCALVFLLIASALFSGFVRLATSPVAPIYLGPGPTWQEMGDWKVYQRVGESEVLLDEASYESHRGMVYFSRKLPSARDAHYLTRLIVKGTDEALQNISAYVDGKLIFSQSGSPDAGQGALSPKFLLGKIDFPIPPSDQEQELTIQAYHGQDSKRLPILVMTDNMIEDAQLVAVSNKDAFPAAAYAVMSVMLVGLFLYGLSRGHAGWTLLILIFCTIGQAGHFASQFTAFFPTSLDVGIWMQSARVLLFVLPSLFLMCQMRRFRWAFFPFLAIPSTCYLLYAFVSLVGSAQLPDMAYRTPELLLVTVVALAVFSGLEYHEKNEWFLLFIPSFLLSLLLLGGIYLLSIFTGGAFTGYVNNLIAQLAQHVPENPLYLYNTLLLGLLIGDSFLLFIRRNAQREAQMQALRVKNEATAQSLALMQEGALALGSARHDMLHQLSVIGGLAEAGEEARLKAYIALLTKQLSDISPLRYSVHPAVNAVLAGQLGRASGLGISAQCDITLPEQVSIPDVDLCTLLMNLVANAVEALEKLPSDQPKWLRVKMHIRGCYLYVGVENARCTPVVFDRAGEMCLTTKGDLGAHGYGLKSAQAIARRYQSKLHIEAPEGAFHISTVLLLPYGIAE